MTELVWLAVMVGFAALGTVLELRDRNNTERRDRAEHEQLMKEIRRHK